MPILSRLAVLAVSLLACSFSAAGQQCSFTLSPGSQSVAAAGGNFTINITASAGSCTRTISSSTPWITVSFGQSGTGSGSAGYTVSPNNTDQARTGTIVVAGISFTVSQSAGRCTYALDPTSATVARSGGNGSFDVVSGCGWTASSNAAWVQLTGAQGTGNGTVGYTVAANLAAGERTATITVGTASFSLRQSSGCSFTTTTGNISATATGGNYSISIQGGDGCSRTATTDVPWITIVSGGSGEGAGTIAITVSTNTNREYRIGQILVNGSAFVLVRQEPSNCVIQLNPRTASAPANGGSLSLAVTANCAWTAVSQVAWIQITGGATGNGSGAVTYTVSQNMDASPRGGAILINSEPFQVSQAGSTCDVSLSDTAFTIATEGGSGTIRVSSLAGCNWTVTASADWIRVVKNAGGGTGADEVTFTVGANPGSTERRGTIVIGGKPVDIRQLPARCTVTIDRSTAQVPAEGGRGELGVTANCGWAAASSVGWIQVTGTTQNLLTYSVSANEGASERTGAITVSPTDSAERLTLTLSQSGQRCSVTPSPAASRVPARGGTGSVAITGGVACSWTAATNAAWLRVEWSSVSGSGNVRFAADANTTGADRNAQISVGNSSISVQQPALRLSLATGGILNAASYAGSGVAPGEVVTLFGSGFGPETLATLQLNADGRSITNLLAGTRVLFDAEPAPMIYAVDGQVSAIVPYGVASKQTVAIQAEYLGVRSSAVTLPVISSAPGIFTAAATGRGQAAVLNQDFTINGPGSPAAKGSIIQIFATGAGQTNPAGTDGHLAASPLPVALLPVAISIAGADAVVTYAGAAPGLVEGVIQVNARIPDGIQSGNEVPVVLRIGGAESPAGPTIAVR